MQPKQLIDSPLFRKNEQRCDLTQESIVCNCDHLSRLAIGLQCYHSSTNSSNVALDFNEFCNNIYVAILDDYIHFICVHSVSSNQISIELEKNHRIKKCNDVNKCNWTRRHYRERNNMKDEEKNQYNFYSEIFDNIHLYLFHLETMGLRLSKSKKHEIQTKSEEQKYNHHIDYANCVDYQFSEVQKELNLNQQKCTVTSDRFNNRYQFTKFNLMTTNFSDNDPTQETFTDNMFAYIMCENNILRELQAFIDAEEFDTDCIIFDTNDNQSNLLLSIMTNNNNNTSNCIDCIDNIRSFSKYYNIASNSFSNGIGFFYWSYYEHIDDEHIHKLVVTKYYSSFKGEVLSSGVVTISEYTRKVINKANKYISAEKVMELKCEFVLGESDPLHFGIHRGDPLQVKHLQAVILYCDFTDFQTEFSKSFRAIKWNEPLELIKSRNSKFYHTARNLKELVQYYGYTGHNVHKDHTQTESGPFYTGMSFVLCLPAFAIKLNGPTSTSKHLEIAFKFSGGRDGVIIQLNNQKGTSVAERCFDCSWISSFPEEDERLFYGGRFMLEIESVRIFDEKNDEWKNYENIINALYLFDAMLSGDCSLKTKVSDTDVNILNSLIDHYLGNATNKLDNYVNDTFYLFCNGKTQITLKLDDIHQDIINIGFIQLIMHSIKRWQTPGKISYWDAMYKRDNLFKGYIFTLFRQLKEITVYAPSTYLFNLTRLLSIITSSASKSFETIIIKTTEDGDQDSWLNYAFSPQIIKMFKAATFEIKFQKKQGEYKNQHWMIISK
eukprot:453403_1